MNHLLWQPSVGEPAVQISCLLPFWWSPQSWQGRVILCLCSCISNSLQPTTALPHMYVETRSLWNTKASISATQHCVHTNCSRSNHKTGVDGIWVYRTTTGSLCLFRNTAWTNNWRLINEEQLSKVERLLDCADWCASLWDHCLTIMK